MKITRIMTVLLLLAGFAVGFYSVSQAQSDSVDAEVTITNQAVFISLTATFVGSDVTAADIEAGITAFTAATFNVDATAGYQLSADTSTSGNTAAPGGATFNASKSAASACQIDIDNNGSFEDGDAVTALTGQTPTTGGGGTNHSVDLQIDWTQYTNAPSGSYTCSARTTVTEE